MRPSMRLRGTRTETEERNAVASAVSRYEIRMRASCGGASVGRDELGRKDAECRREAAAAFSQHGSRRHHLQEKFEDELEKRLLDRYQMHLLESTGGLVFLFTPLPDRLEALYRVYRKDGDARQKEAEEAETLPRDPAAPVVDRYDAEMRRLLEGPLISEEEMGRRDAEFRRRARVTLAEIGSRWPQLSGDFQKELENNMQARYEIYRKERLARQSRAESQLRNALEAAVERYDAQTNRSLVAASIGERESGATDADFRREALGTFSNIAACYPNISKKFEDELKTRLQSRQGVYREASEAVIRLKKSVASIVDRYDDRMRRSTDGPLASERELRARDAELRAEALADFLEVAVRCPPIWSKFETELENRLDDRFKIYEKSRNAREALERKAETVLRDAVASAACRYDARMSLLCGLCGPCGGSVGEEELEARHDECRTRAFATLAEHGSQFPHLSERFRDELDQLLREKYDKYKRARERQEKDAEDSLARAVVSALDRYESRMIRFLDGPWRASREELRDRHAEYSREAIRAVWERGRRHPRVSGAHVDKFARFLKRRYEESEKRRSTAEKEAEAELDEACSRAAEEYERRRQRLYGATVVDGETLLDGHRMQMDAALASFRRNAGGHPEWQVGKYEKVLTEMLDARHDDLEKRMAEERKRRRLTSLVTFSAAVLSGTATANATTKTALGTGLVVGSFIAGWWLSPGIVESRLGGNVVVPEAPHQTAQRKRRRYQ